jgi:hypothetical protein
MVFCFVQKFVLGYMTKTLNQIIIFFLHQIQNIFFSNIGNQNIFLEKKTYPPFKLNGRSLRKGQILFGKHIVILPNISLKPISSKCSSF